MEENREFLMFAAAVGQAGFGHIFAQSLCVGPIGTVAVSCRTEEPGEQRFCQDQRLKQPMGLPFSEWADNKTHPPVAMARIPVADCGNRTYLSETTNDLLCLTEAFGAPHPIRGWDQSTWLLFRTWSLQQTSMEFPSNNMES
jgi:hypothetical protein